MGTPLRVLIIEDTEEDTALVLRELTRGGYTVTWKRIDDAGALLDALSNETWDVILSDYSMPRFSAPEAFRMVRERSVDVPFIIVSGTVGEEVAVEAMRSGVHDYLLKDNLVRLTPVVERELREAELRAERRRMQEQLVLSDRMASVGTLAAGVAHEINNPLAAVIANLESIVERFAKQDIAPGPPDACLAEIREPLKEAFEAASRVLQISRDLKIFSRPADEAATPQPVDVRRVVDAAVRMASNELRHRARVTFDHAEAPIVLATESRLVQVFLNLVVNAAQAIPDGHFNENEIRITTRAAGDRVLIEVKDTGCGIAPELLPRIFDPFYTTKPIGVGTGLGLAICHRLVASFNGTMAVESEVGRGTTFCVVLPASHKPASKDAARPDAHAATPSRRGRILVVDDEPMVGRAVARILKTEHDIVVVGSAREGLSAIKDATYDLVLCDLMMPEMSGIEFHAELVKNHPKMAMRVVFMTGGAFTSAAREFLDAAQNERVDKPFEAASLRKVVSRLLVEHGAS